MNEQENFWKDKYADSYIEKNTQFNFDLGVKGWRKMLQSIVSEDININSILECGPNIGRNIGFINAVYPQAKKSIIEISEPAYKKVKNTYELEQHCNTSIIDSHLEGSFNLVFTIGVLIHIHPNDLLANMEKMYSYSDKYILMGEYFNRTPTMIEYQGESNKLFKSNFGKTFKDHFDVRLVDYGFLWGEEYDSAGFDDITFWLFEKK